jgi:hypothetical protein
MKNLEAIIAFFTTNQLFLASYIIVFYDKIECQ